MNQYTEKMVIKVEDRFGEIEEVKFGSLKEVVMYVEKQMEKMGQGFIDSIFICKQTIKKTNFQLDLLKNQDQQDENLYDIQLLKQQLLLFDREQDITNFIETQKCLAENSILQLSELSFCLMKLSKQLLTQKKPSLDYSMKEQTYTREKLDTIESQCIATLTRVKEERKRIEACCICLQRKSNCVILPCMHLVLCTNCGGPVRRCPICMQPISQIRQIFQ